MKKQEIPRERKKNNNSSPSLTVGFLGLGLIGGSIAKSIRRIFPHCIILAFDPDQKAIEQAWKEGVITNPLQEVSTELSQCDYIFLCAPVHYNLEYLPKLQNLLSPHCILTDVGSVKSDIYEAVVTHHLEPYFIGGHPMVGSDQSGYEASKEHLLENAYYFLTPTPSISKQKCSQFSSFITSLGALPIEVTPEYHDKITASISHVPHVVASSLVRLVQQEDSNGLLKKLAAGGFKDITRIASSSPLIWQHILLSNPNNLMEQLTQFQQILEMVKQAILAKDEKMLYDFFDEAKEYRNSVPDTGVGVIQKQYEIYVDVVDQPGVLAIVTTILGSNQISIKNIGIIHSREYTEGALNVTFYDEESLLLAIEILKKYNFTVFTR